MQFSRPLRLGLAAAAFAFCQSGIAADQPTDAGKAVADVFGGAAPAGATAESQSVPAATSDGTTTWTVTEADVNYRLLLSKIAAQQGFGFVWDYDQDVPIIGHDTFTGTFKQEVRHVLAATELLDTPLQPCWYTNNVLRVTRKTAKCDPSQ